jgi:hypothetical protein
MCNPNDSAMIAITRIVEIVTPRNNFFFKNKGCDGRAAVVIFITPCYSSLREALRATKQSPIVCGKIALGGTLRALPSQHLCRTPVQV